MYFNGETSSNLGVTCRVPQSSVLEPLPFLLYINDLADLKNHGDLVFSADDTTIVGELKTNYIHDDLTAVELWMSQNKLTISQSKTKVSTFLLNIPSKSKWNEIKLEHPGYAKLLGVCLDKDLNCSEHARVKKTNALNSSLSSIRQK